MFLSIQLTLFQHWFRKWLSANQATSHYLNQWWLVCRRIHAPFGLNELRRRCQNKIGAISQRTFPNLYLLMKNVLFWLQFHSFACIIPEVYQSMPMRFMWWCARHVIRNRLILIIPMSMLHVQVSFKYESSRPSHLYNADPMPDRTVFIIKLGPGSLIKVKINTIIKNKHSYQC